MQIIQNNNASDYIQFMGFQCLDEVYQNYELYITENGKNGYLIDYNYDCTKEYENELVKSIASKIIRVFADYKKLNDFKEYSYKIANEFLETKISEKWRKML